jgi:ferredoxin-NADP reductase
VSEQDTGDTTQVSLLYANRSTQDILLRRELDELARDHPQFQVWYTGNDHTSFCVVFVFVFVSKSVISSA